jgi:phenylalanyl-tRNA synthetase alpha chain
MRRFYHIWAEMGFQIYRSREVEDDAHNFTLVNFPPDHPARDMQDTFYTTDPDVMLRTQTTSGQVRAMHDLSANGTQPIRILVPGLCYRYEAVSVRSDIQFHQVEGLAIGRNIRMSDLTGTLREFVHKLWGQNVRSRFRNSYFPFVEPGMETDVECFLCGGSGCRVCKYSGWIEIGGSGMVHPNVLRNGGYDPTEWSGFAFGLGIERMNLNLYDVRDIRLFWQNDLRLLEQF